VLPPIRAKPRCRFYYTYLRKSRSGVCCVGGGQTGKNDPVDPMIIGAGAADKQPLVWPGRDAIRRGPEHRTAQRRALPLTTVARRITAA
jgi:hypothetical protein